MQSYFSFLALEHPKGRSTTRCTQFVTDYSLPQVGSDARLPGPRSKAVHYVCPAPVVYGSFCCHGIKAFRLARPVDSEPAWTCDINLLHFLAEQDAKKPITVLETWVCLLICIYCLQAPSACMMLKQILRGLFQIKPEEAGEASCGMKIFQFRYIYLGLVSIGNVDLRIKTVLIDITWCITKCTPFVVTICCLVDCQLSLVHLACFQLCCATLVSQSHSTSCFSTSVKTFLHL